MSARRFSILSIFATLSFFAFCEEAAPKHPITLAASAKAAWQAFVKNDFAAAEKEFKKALDANPNDLDSLEGLRWTFVSSARYKEAQTLNLRMLQLSKGDALGSLFGQRAADGMMFVESRAEVLDTFAKVAPDAAPVVRAYLRDELSYLYAQTGKYEEARKAIEGNGYVGRWIFAAGPFGAKDRSNPIERRYAPERALTSLDFKDENGKPVKVARDLVNLDRDLDLDSVFRDAGGSGIYYVLTNLESDAERDVILIIVADSPNRIYLRGKPIAAELDDEVYRRNGGQLYRVRLAKGDNPLMLKLGILKPLIVRVCGEDYGPPEGVKAAGMSEQALASHEVSTTRGIVFSEKVVGSTAALLLKKLTKDEGDADDKDDRKGDLGSEKGKRRLRALAMTGALTLPEAVWLELVLQRENDPVAREALSRRLFGTFGDSVGVLDIAAAMLGASGLARGNNEARETEEARRLREHALQILPTSQQHLIGLADFFRSHELAERAFELVKKCAEAHADSAFAQAELGREYIGKHFLVEAEQCFEKAAKIDNAQLRQLADFHDAYGTHARAREIREKMRALDLMGLEERFGEAISREDFSEAERLLELQAKWQPERSAENDERRVQLLVNKGDLEGAYTLRKTLYAAQTGRTGKRAQPGQLVDLAVRLGKMDEAKSLLTEYLAKHPGDFESRRRLRDLSGSEAKQWWSDYDVNVADIDTARYDTAHYPSANHAWIVDFMTTKVMPDLSRESYVHIAQKVLNLKGIGELSEVLVRAQREDIVFIRTLNPDGSAYMPQNVHNFNLEQTASLYKVGPGSILEHAYLEHLDADEDEPAFRMSFNFNALDAPRAVSRWVVMIPDAVKDKLEITRIRPEMLDEQILKGPAGFTTYQWTNKRVEGIKAEPMMPRETDQEIIPLVTIETRDIPVRAGGFMQRRRREQIPEEAKAKARELAAAAKALPASKGRVESAVFESIIYWIRDNIEIASDSRTLDDVWFGKKGGGLQMQSLAREMCLAAGLNVHTALLNINYMPAHVWHSKTAKKMWEPSQLVSFANGAQMLLLEPPFGNERWAQFPGRGRPRFYSPFEPTPFPLALVVGDDGVRLKRVLGDRLGTTAYRQTLKVSFDATGSASTVNTFQLFGMSAGAYRERLNDPRMKERVKDMLARGTWAKQKLTNFQIVNETDTEKPLGFNFVGQIDSLAEHSNGAYYLLPFPDMPAMLQMRAQAARESDIVIYDDGMYSEFDRAVEYHAPEGHAWSEIPDDIFLVTEFGFYAADYNAEGRVLHCTRSSLIPAQRITPEKYPEFQNFLKQIAEHAGQRIAYTPYNAKEFGGRTRDVFSQGYVLSGEDRKQKGK